MSDAKLADEDAAPVVDVTSISVEPNMCQLEAPLALDVAFSLDSPVIGGVWEVKVRRDPAR